MEASADAQGREGAGRGRGAGQGRADRGGLVCYRNAQRINLNSQRILEPVNGLDSLLSFDTAITVSCLWLHRYRRTTTWATSGCEDVNVLEIGTRAQIDMY